MNDGMSDVEECMKCPARLECFHFEFRQPSPGSPSSLIDFTVLTSYTLLNKLSMLGEHHLTASEVPGRTSKFTEFAAHPDLLLSEDRPGDLHAQSGRESNKIAR